MTYDQEFAQAMKIKLERNRQTRNLQSSEALPRQNALYDRSAEVDKLLARHPDLTREDAERGLKELGF